MSRTRLLGGLGCMIVVSVLFCSLLADADWATSSVAAAQSLAGDLSPAQPTSGEETAEAKCAKTDVAGKCGTDLQLEPVQCGGATCYQTIITYGQVYNCVAADTGFGRKECKDCGDCMETVRKFVCEASVCKATSEGAGQSSTGVPTTCASGDVCVMEEAGDGVG